MGTDGNSNKSEESSIPSWTIDSTSRHLCPRNPVMTWGARADVLKSAAGDLAATVQHVASEKALKTSRISSCSMPE